MPTVVKRPTKQAGQPSERKTDSDTLLFLTFSFFAVALLLLFQIASNDGFVNRRV